MKRPTQTTLTEDFMDHRQQGIEIKVFIVSLSTRSAESTRAVAVSDTRNEWRMVLSMPIPIDTRNDMKKPFCGATDNTSFTWIASEIQTLPLVYHM